MISNDLTLIDRYLKHPSKEPEYRRGRPHTAFVTTLALEYPDLSYARIQQTVDDTLQQRILEIT